MKIQGKMFLWLSFFILIMAIVYGVWSKEPVGTTALFLAFGLSVMIGYYLAFTAKRVDEMAQDNLEADVADEAGELGFFSPHSWQPLSLGIGGALASWASSSAGGSCTSRPDHPDRPVGLGVRVLPR